MLWCGLADLRFKFDLGLPPKGEGIQCATKVARVKEGVVAVGCCATSISANTKKRYQT